MSDTARLVEQLEQLHRAWTFELKRTPSPVVTRHLDELRRAAALTDEGRAANKGLSLTHYMRSGAEWDAYRAFCSTCGASVLYDFSDRPDITNIAAGLIKAEEGIMARRWVSWSWGETSFKDSYIDREVRDAWMAAEGTQGVPQL